MTDTLGKSLLLTQDAIKNPHLDSTNPHFGSKFASLGAHLDAILPVANANGLVVLQEPCIADGQPALRTRVIHAGTFEFIESTMPLAVDKNGPQGQGSAITYARRYALASIFGVVGETDDDGNAASKPATVPPAVAGAGAKDATVTRAGTPAPVAAPNPIQAAAEKAQAAQAATRQEPSDGGDPSEVVLHFGKNQGRRLGDLSAKQIEWYATTWQANPQYENDQDRRVKAAAQLLAGHVPVPAVDADDIPF